MNVLDYIIGYIATLQHSVGKALAGVKKYGKPPRLLGFTAELFISFCTHLTLLAPKIRCRIIVRHNNMR